MLLFNDMSLQRLTKISYVTSLWENPRVKNKVKKFFKNTRASNTNQEHIQQEWATITQEVLKEINILHLPAPLDLELRSMIRSIGLNLFNFIKYVTKNLWFKWNWADKIHWTCRGTVDVARMFNEVWVNRFDSLNKFSYFYVACGCALFDTVNSLSDALKFQLEYYYNADALQHYGEWVPPNRRYRLLAGTYLILNQSIDDINQFIPHYRPVEVTFFRMCLLEGFISGVEFFWSKMTTRDKNRNVTFAVKKCINMYDRSKENGARRYVANNYIEILAFIYSEMSERMKQKIISNKVDYIVHKLLKMFSTLWPWHDYFLDLLERKKKSVKGYYLNGVFYFGVLNSLSKKIGKEEKLGFDVEKSANFKLFKIVWFTMPSGVKLDREFHKTDKWHLHVCVFYNIVVELLKRSEIACLKVIFNSERFQNNMDCVIDYISGDHFYDEVERISFDLINRFRSEILSTENDKIRLDHKIFELCDTFLEDGSFEIADNILNFLSSLSQDRVYWKNKIDIFRVLEHMICNDIKSVNKFLRWYFPDLNEARAFVTVLRGFDFVSDMIIQIWVKPRRFLFNRNTSVQSRTKTFLSWIFGANDPIKFKKFCFRNELIELFFRKFADSSCWKIRKNLEIKIINKIFNFFSAGEIEINAIKRNFVTNAPYWIKFCLVEKQAVQLIGILLDWCCNGDEEKLNLLKNFLKSNNGVVLFNLLPERYKDFVNDDFVKFLNSYVKPNVRELVEIKNSLKRKADCLVDHAEEELVLKNTLKLVSAFEKFEIGEDVSLTDF